MPKHFVVFAGRFEHGAWKYWEHECDKEDIPALEDSATAYAFSRTPSGQPLYIDYLRGAEYLFMSFMDAAALRREIQGYLG